VIGPTLSRGEDPVSKQSLDYPSPRPGRRTVHRGYLAATIVCFALTALSFIITTRNMKLTGPDPPPPGDPHWKQVKQEERWFVAGCCSMPVFAVLGLVFLYGAFAAARSSDGGAAAE
jgi:hypothetical protein